MRPTRRRRRPSTGTVPRADSCSAASGSTGPTRPTRASASTSSARPRRQDGHAPPSRERSTPATSPTRATSGTVHWFRKDFRLPSRDPGSKWVFRFESVNYRAKVWLNGKPLGAHVGSYLPFEVRAKSVKRGRVNRLVVRVDGRRQKFDIPPLSQRASGSFEGGWWNYTGILREVYLRRVKNLDLEDVFVRPRLRCRTLRRHASSSRPASGQLRQPRAVGRGSWAASGASRSASGQRGSAAVSSRKFRGRARIRNPRLWWPDRPHLYTVRARRLRRRAPGSALHRPHRHQKARGEPARPGRAERPRGQPARSQHPRGQSGPGGGPRPASDAHARWSTCAASAPT